MTLLLDVHEPDEIEKYLLGYHIPVERKHLEVGDVVIGTQVIERKEIHGFFIDKHNGRLGIQISNMLASYKRPILIVEGKLPSYEFNPRERMELYTYVALSKNIQVIFTEDIRDTCRCLLAIYNAENNHAPYVAPRLFSKHETDPYNIKVQMLRCIKGIGEKKAKLILDNFKLHELFSANEEDLVKLVKNKEAVRLLKQVFSKDDLKVACVTATDKAERR